MQIKTTLRYQKLTWLSESFKKVMFFHIATGKLIQLILESSLMRLKIILCL